MFAWQFAELQLTAKMNNWTQFVSMQNHHNLVYREEEREMNPYASTQVGLTPWSPLARGILPAPIKAVLAAAVRIALRAWIGRARKPVPRRSCVPDRGARY